MLYSPQLVVTVTVRVRSLFEFVESLHKCTVPWLNVMTFLVFLYSVFIAVPLVDLLYFVVNRNYVLVTCAGSTTGTFGVPAIM
jgi:hypothetical protein